MSFNLLGIHSKEVYPLFFIIVEYKCPTYLQEIQQYSRSTCIENTNPKRQKNFQLINEWEQGRYESCGHLCIVLSLILWLLRFLLRLLNLPFHWGSEGCLNAETILGHPHPARPTGREGLVGTAHYVSTLCCVPCNALPAWPSVLTYRCLTDILSRSCWGPHLHVSLDLAIKQG